MNVDNGYQGIAEYHANSVVPFKKGKNRPLTLEEKAFNRRLARERIAIVLDNAAYQRCYWVREYAVLLDINLMFLPSYSPNLNLIERLWKFVKKESLNNRYYESFETFKRGIDMCLNDIDKKHQTQVATLMNLRFQTFKNDQIMAG